MPAPSPANRIEELQAEKLQLEVDALKRAANPRTTLFDRLKALTAYGAIFGALWTLYTAVTQLEANRKAALENRLASATSDIFSKEPRLRLNGLSQLQTFLSSKGNAEQQRCLDLMVGALAYEDDPYVANQILGSLGRLDTKLVSHDAISEALTLSLDSNRRLLASSRMPFITLATSRVATDGTTLWTAPSLGNATPFPYPLAQKRAADKDEDHFFQHLSDLAAASVILLAKGGDQKDFSRIYCPSCDFASSKRDLSGADFTRAILRGASFKGLHLSSAKFTDAFLVDSDFTGAALDNAKLDTSRDDVYDYFAFTGSIGNPPRFPSSDLSGAHLAGRTTLLLSGSNIINVPIPFDDHTRLAHTDLERSRVACVSGGVKIWLGGPGHPQNYLCGGPVITKVETPDAAYQWSYPESFPRFEYVFGKQVNESLAPDALPWVKSQFATNAAFNKAELAVEALEQKAQQIVLQRGRASQPAPPTHP